MIAANTPKVPPLRHHKASDQSFVWIDGRSFYLGKHGVPETLQKYHQFVAEWLAGSSKFLAPPNEITVLEVVDQYMQYAKGYYRTDDGRPSNEIAQICLALGPLQELYSQSKVAQFGPLALRAVRERMIERGWCRTHINHNIGRIKRMFRWATENEIVPGSLYHALQAVIGLRRGRSQAPETEPVRPVSQNLVDAVQPHVSSQVWAMIQLQRLACVFANGRITSCSSATT